MQLIQDLQQRVEQNLREDGRVASDNLAVTVEAGVVTLSGSVKTLEEFEAAEEIALRTDGVLDVANEIQITSQPDLSDAHLAEMVRASLQGHLESASQQIQCCVSHGVVTLHGGAASWQEVAEAEQAAAEVGGVQDVLDEIEVRKSKP